MLPALVGAVAVVDLPVGRRGEPALQGVALPGPPSAALRASGTVVGTTVTAASWAPVIAAPAAVEVPVEVPVQEAPQGDLVIEPPPEVFEEVAEPAAPPPATLVHAAGAGGPQGVGTWAVSIGIDDYPGSRHDLRSAVADAVEVDQALAGYGVPADQRLLVTDRTASADTIERSLEWLVANAGPDANVVFFYAGHVRKLSQSTEAIVAADGAVVRDERVAALLSPLAAQRAWIAIAACYGGGFTEVVAPGRILTAAADANNLAYENAGFGRSYLVEYMVRRAMVQGKAAGSVEVAYDWAEAALAREHPDRIPFQVDHLEGDLVLGSGGAQPAEDPPPPAEPAPSQPPPPSQDPPPQQPPAEEEEEPDRSDRCLGHALRAIRCGGD